MGALSLNVIRDVLGADLSADVIVAAGREADTIGPRICEEYYSRLESEPNHGPPTKPVGHIRPLINELWPVAGGGRWADRTLDVLTFPLLYGHSAAAPDVLAVQQPDDFDLASVLHVYALAAPLLDADVLIFLDPPIQAPVPLPGDSREFDLTGLGLRLRSLMRTVPKAQRGYTGLLSVDYPERDILGRWLWAVETSSTVSVDPFPTSRSDSLALRMILGIGGRMDHQSEHPLLGVMYSQTTPKLERLTTSDILNVRNSEAFSEWRMELSAGLADLDARIRQGLPDAGHIEFVERFDRRLHALEGEVRSSAAAQAWRVGRRTLSLSLMGAVATSPLTGLGGIDQALIAGAGAATAEMIAVLGPLVRTWLRADPADASLANHYRVFASTD